ncbi:MAG: hypothetical protein JSW59_16560 [Phycisphaerales bacterium]|nr:MAG: hypothetical protein JSW59_16560 [Phycisphaerales bacterium]
MKQEFFEITMGVDQEILVMNIRFQRLILPLVLVLVALSVGHAEECAQINDRWELLVDDYIIDRMKGEIELRLHSPTVQEVVLTHDKPWEGNTSGYHTIFKDGEICRMYYRGWNHDDKTQKQLHPALVCYAQSRDGIHWERPNLGLVDFRESKENNIILSGFGTHNFTPFKDSNPRCRAGALYKAVARGEGKDSQNLFAFESPDGIHWRLTQQGPIITEGAFDSQNLAFWDSVRGEYRCYFRDFRDGFRGIKTSTSEDFRSWRKPMWLSYGDAPAEHLYTNQIQPYYRSPHIFIGFPTRYIPQRGSLTEGLFMSSRDGLKFHRWQEAVLRPGLNRSKWQNRSNYIWLGMLETQSKLPGGGKELSIFSNEGYYKGTGGSTRRYTYRIDGFVSLHGSFQGGEMITKPLIFKGRSLIVNFSTSAAGSLRVEIQDSGGKAVEGYALSECREIYGDEIERLVQWRNSSDVSNLAGEPIRLRFVLKDADVFAFGFRDE